MSRLPRPDDSQMISEINLSQYTIDSLTLTPLVKASYSAHPPMRPTSHSSNNTNNNNSLISNGRSNKAPVVVTTVKENGDYKLDFAAMPLNESNNFEMTLSNSTLSYVHWKAFSTTPAMTKKFGDNNLVQSKIGAFTFTPSSGIIPVGQKKTVRIEFRPRDSAPAEFTQTWQIDTRSDLQSVDKINAVFNSKLILCGKSLPPLTEKRSLSSQLENIGGFYLNSQGSSSASSLLSSSSLSTCSSTSSIASSENKTGSNAMKSMRLLIKEELLNFGEVKVGESKRMTILIHNSDTFDCWLNIPPITEPFYCKHSQIELKSKHFIKVPIVFKPRAVCNEYVGKFALKVDKFDEIISILMRGRSYD